MKFKRAWDFKEVPTEWGFVEAIEAQIQEGTHSAIGAVETVEVKVESASRMVCSLVGVLVDKGLLNQDDVLKLLPSFEAVK